MEETLYYTPKEAMEILGMTYSALQNQVIAGNLRRIIPPGRRQGVYLKEDVNKLRRELDAFMIMKEADKTGKVTFVKATLDDMDEVVQLASRYGADLTIPVETRKAWLHKNPDIDYLVKDDGQIEGYISLVPLAPETIQDLLSARRYAKNLTESDILSFKVGEPIDIYAMAMFIKYGVNLAQKRIYGSELIKGVMNTIVEFGRRGIVIKTIQAHSNTPDGIRFMRHAGFTETASSIPGMRDFIIEVERSGIPFIMEYKAALKKVER